MYSRRWGLPSTKWPQEARRQCGQENAIDAVGHSGTRARHSLRPGGPKEQSPLTS